MQAEFRDGDDRPHKVQEVSSGAAIRTFITRHCNILISIHYRVRTLTSHNTEESENTPESPYLGEIKRIRRQCVPGSLFPRPPRAWVRG